MESSSTQIKCPQCGRLTLYSPTNASRPFCSERCKLIDLGQWASENYKIPVKQNDGYLTDLESELEAELDKLNPEDFITVAKSLPKSNKNDGSL